METMLIINGSAEDVAALVETVARLGLVTVSWGAETLPPLPGWEQLPEAGRLSRIERAIIQRDLRGDARRQTASALELTPGTITVYRRHIRQKLLRTPCADLPQWALVWLQRFPGLGDGARG